MSNVTGVKELNAALSKLPVKIAEKVVKKSLRKGANLVAKRARQNAPVVSGRLKKSITVINSRYNRLNRNGIVGLVLKYRKPKSRKDPKAAYYAPWVERGYNRGSKRIGVHEAIARGVTTRKEADAKRRAINARRRPGRSKQGQSFRYGGARVEGQFIIDRAYESLKNEAATAIIRSGEEETAKAAKELGL